MIYIIITTSIHNRHGLKDVSEAEKRKARYLYAITESLRHVPAHIQPILVENNGKRSTYIDDFYHMGKKVPVVYTSNNDIVYKSKGINEFLDLKDVIRIMNIQPDDMIIKLTGRYRLLSSSFVDEVLANETVADTADTVDALVMFFGSCSLQYERYDCILGCYAIRSKYILMFHPTSIENYKSAEIAFAKYVRLCGLRYKEIQDLGVECLFSENNQILNV